MSTSELEPAIIVLAPNGGGASLVLRALAGHPELAAFDDAGQLLPLLEKSGDQAQLRPSDLQPILGQAGGRRYALHAAGCAGYADILGALFPEAPMIHVVRDPRAVVLQAAKTALVAEPLAGRASAWLRETSALLLFELANPGRVVRLPYESLLSDPQGACERLCRALGLSPEPDAMAAGIRESLPEEEYVFQRGSLDGTELDELERALQPILAVLGFRPATLPSHGRGAGGARKPLSLADEVASLRAERDRYAEELQELRRRLAEEPPPAPDVDELRWKAKRYDRMRAAAAPLRVLKRLGSRLRT